MGVELGVKMGEMALKEEEAAEEMGLKLEEMTAKMEVAAEAVNSQSGHMSAKWEPKLEICRLYPYDATKEQEDAEPGLTRIMEQQRTEENGDGGAEHEETTRQITRTYA